MHWPLSAAPDLFRYAGEVKLRDSHSHRWERPSRQCGSATCSSSTTSSAPARAAVRGHALRRMRGWWAFDARPAAAPSCPARAARQGCARCKRCPQSFRAHGDAFSGCPGSISVECTLPITVLRHADVAGLAPRGPGYPAMHDLEDCMVHNAQVSQGHASERGGQTAGCTGAEQRVL